MAQEGGTPEPVHGDDTGTGRFHGKKRPAVRGSAHAERDDRARVDVAERLHELERHLLVLDRVDEPVTQAMPNAEDLFEPVSHGPRCLLPLPAKYER